MRPEATIAPAPVPQDARLSAAMRLVSGTGRERIDAARRLIESAPRFGIDLELMWATFAPGVGGQARQVCLAVPGSGRTAMLFLSGPEKCDRHPNARELSNADSAQHAERVAVVRAAIEGLQTARPDKVRLAQALPEPGEAWALDAFRAAGMQWVGDLAYLRRGFTPSTVPGPTPDWPDGVEVRPLTGLAPAQDRPALVRALERTYRDTRDCPELCGLRETEDVIDSHRSTGNFDPTRWLLVTLNGEPEGCCLLSVCPEQRSVELVYLGLSPALRGKGLARPLIEYACSRITDRRAREINCAVDRRNEPALRLYRALGFEEFAARTALVAPIGR